MFTVATWNVNSIKARLPLVLEWLEKHKPDTLMLQEIKCKTETFPAEDFLPLGYTSSVWGQAAYNGVATLSRKQPHSILNTLPGFETDMQARFQQLEIEDWTLINIYAPNGNPLGTEKFSYKQEWAQHLYLHSKNLLNERRKFLIAGDFNIIPELLDARHPENWRHDALFQPESRQCFRSLCNLGMTDTYRSLYPDQEHAYTFWDYQAGSWQRDNGIRIDHILTSPKGADNLVKCCIDTEPRAKERPSDHTPIVAVFEN